MKDLGSHVEHNNNLVNRFDQLGETALSFI